MKKIFIKNQIRAFRVDCDNVVIDAAARLEQECPMTIVQGLAEWAGHSGLYYTVVSAGEIYKVRAHFLQNAVDNPCDLELGPGAPAKVSGAGLAAMAASIR